MDMILADLADFITPEFNIAFYVQSINIYVFNKIWLYVIYFSINFN